MGYAEHETRRPSPYRWGVAGFFLTLALASATIAAGSSTDRMIAIYQRILRVRPDDAESFYKLGDAYVEKGRETGDVAYFELGAQALRKALKSDPGLGPAHRHLALVLYTLHDFAGAIGHSQAALKLDPRDSYAYGVMGDAELETGDYQGAARSYATMIALRADLYSYARRSGLESVRGETTACVADLKRAIADGQRGGKPAESVAWVQWQLGNEYFKTGNLAGAQQSYQDSLKTYPGYHRALAGMAQMRAAQGHLPAAAELYNQAIAVIPMPEYAAALADVYTMMGRTQEASREQSLVEFIGRLNKINKTLYNRSLAYFYADHDLEVPAALELAGAELKARRDIYGHDVMAWALYKSGQPRAAAAEIHAALSFGTQDPRLYYHAGMIEFKLGLKDRARRNLSRALALNPHFQPIQDQVAAGTLAMLAGDAR
ncbi:MAG TPA: tetratricopeptide repeat protein [Candidatus Binataceae bacterium]|nr:tetratricopeptide repeat protein [Candidatus Binataceae bacterium]